MDKQLHHLDVEKMLLLQLNLVIPIMKFFYTLLNLTAVKVNKSSDFTGAHNQQMSLPNNSILPLGYGYGSDDCETGAEASKRAQQYE